MRIGRHLFECYSTAVYQLAIGTASIGERLLMAFQALNAIAPDELPPDLKVDHERVMKQMVRLGDRYPNENAARATLFRIKKMTGEKIAKNIVAIHEAMSFHGTFGDPLDVKIID